MKVSDFSKGKQLKKIAIETLLENNEFSSKVKTRLSEIRSLYKPGDFALHYCSERQEWDAGMGSEGYAVVRGDEIIYNLVLKMN